MGKTTENRLRKLERDHPPSPYPEVSFGDLSEEELVALRDLARAALAGDTAAERRLNAALAGKVMLLLPPPPELLPESS